MAIREAELPGVGKKYTLDTQAKEQVAIVIHQTGKREIYYFASGATTPTTVIELGTEEAQQLGGILSQTYVQPTLDPSRELVMKELTIEWLTLPPDHLLLGKNLRTLAIRERSGASIVAILREGKAIINPNPDEALHKSDTITVIGNAAQVQKFKELFQLQAPATA